MEKLTTTADLSECSLVDAVRQAGGVEIPHVIVSPGNKYIAQRLCSRIGWSWSVDEDLPEDAWKVRVNGKTIYSDGA